MEEKYSHATVMHLVYGLVGKNRIYQFGIRSGTKEEFDFAKEHTIMEKFDVKTIKKIIEQIKGLPIYVTIDLD